MILARSSRQTRRSSANLNPEYAEKSILLREAYDIRHGKLVATGDFPPNSHTEVLRT